MFERTKHIPPWSAAAMTFEKVGYGGAALFDEFTEIQMLLMLMTKKNLDSQNLLLGNHGRRFRW